MDCDSITSNLFVGSCLLDVNEVEELRSLGVTAILSLQTEQDMGKRGIEWEEKAALATKLAFRSMPVRDFDAADLQRKLPECVAVLDRMLKAGHTVYLHCTAGTGRSPTLAAAYLHWCLAWPLERALAHVREARDCSPNVEAIRLRPMADLTACDTAAGNLDRGRPESASTASGTTPVPATTLPL